LKITGVDKWLVRVPCVDDVLQRSGRWAESSRESTGTSLSNFDLVPKWIVRIRTDTDIVGIGESLRGETTAAIDSGIAALIGKDPRSFPPLALPLPPEADYETFEMAVLDLLGKYWDVPVHVLLGGAVRESVEVSYWATRQSPQGWSERAKEARAQQFGSIKVKAALKSDEGVEDDDPVHEGVMRIQEASGPSFGVVIDANYRFHSYALTLLIAEELAGSAVTVLEDPMPWAGQLPLYAELRRESPIPIAIHIASPRTAMAAISASAVDCFNLYGPMKTFVRTAWLASQAGLPCWHGSGLDLGIRSAAHVQASAAAASCTMPGDVIGVLFRKDDLILDPLHIEHGRIRVPDGAGLGVELDEAAVRAFLVKP
jgi:muconate cycloisomerase